MSLDGHPAGRAGHPAKDAARWLRAGRWAGDAKPAKVRKPLEGITRRRTCRRPRRREVKSRRTATEVGEQILVTIFGTVSASTSSAPSRQRLSGGRTPIFRWRRGNARIDVSSRAWLDARLHTFTRCEGHARCGAWAGNRITVRNVRVPGRCRKTADCARRGRCATGTCHPQGGRGKASEVAQVKSRRARIGIRDQDWD